MHQVMKTSYIFFRKTCREGDAESFATSHDNIKEILR